MIAVGFYLAVLAAMGLTYLAGDLIWCRYKAIREQARVNRIVRLQRAARSCERVAR